MKQLVALLNLVGFMFAFSAAAYAQTTILIFQGDFNQPREVYFYKSDDLSTPYRTATVTAADPAYTIGSINGAAYDPETDKIYIIAGSNGMSSSRALFELDTTNATARFIVNPVKDHWQNLAVTPDGRFFMTPGTGNALDGNNVLFELDTITGAVTQRTVMSSPGTSSKVGLVFNADDDQLYGSAGAMNLSSSDAFFSLDTSNWSQTNISNPAGGAIFGYGLAYIGEDTLLALDGSIGFDKILTDGTVLGQSGSITNVNGIVIAAAAYYTPSASTPCPTLTLNLPSSGATELCTNETDTITVSASGGFPMGTQIEWYRYDQSMPPVPVLDASLGTDTFAVVGSGQYEARLANVTCSNPTSSNTVTLNELNIPGVNITTLDDGILCDGESEILVGADGGSLQWFRNGVMLMGENDDSLTVTQAGFYNQMKTNMNGCSDTAAMAFEIESVPNPIAFPNPGDVCIGSGAISLNATPTGGNYLSNGVLLTNPLDPDTLLGTVITYVFDTAGCSYEETVVFQVIQPNNFDFTLSDTVINLADGDSSIIATIINPDPGYTYEWEYGAGAIGVGSTFELGFNSPDTLTITLTSIINGCAVQRDTTIRVIDLIISRAELLNIGQSIYPNPVDDVLSIGIKPQKQTLDIEIISLDGRSVFRGELPANTASYELPTEALDAGVYLLTFSSGEGSVSVRFVKR